MAASAPGSSVLTTSLPGPAARTPPAGGSGLSRIYVLEVVVVDLSRWLRREEERRAVQRAERAFRERPAVREHRPDDSAMLEDGRVHDRATGQWRMP